MPLPCVILSNKKQIFKKNEEEEEKKDIPTPATLRTKAEGRTSHAPLPWRSEQVPQVPSMWWGSAWEARKRWGGGACGQWLHARGLCGVVPVHFIIQAVGWASSLAQICPMAMLHAAALEGHLALTALEPPAKQPRELPGQPGNRETPRELQAPGFSFGLPQLRLLGTPEGWTSPQPPQMRLLTTKFPCSLRTIQGWAGCPRGPQGQVCVGENGEGQEWLDGLQQAAAREGGGPPP